MQIDDELERRELAAPGGDPFQARSEQAIQPEPITAVGARPSPFLQPQAPPLPFAYIGKLHKDPMTIAVLATKDRNYVVQAGDTLDGTYGVEAIDDQRVVLKYLPLGIRQTVLFAAPAAAAPGAVASAVPLPAIAASGAPASGVPPVPPRALPGPVLVPEHPDPALKEEE